MRLWFFFLCDEIIITIILSRKYLECVCGSLPAALFACCRCRVRWWHDSTDFILFFLFVRFKCTLFRLSFSRYLCVLLWLLFGWLMFCAAVAICRYVDFPLFRTLESDSLLSLSQFGPGTHDRELISFYILQPPSNRQHNNSLLTGWLTVCVCIRIWVCVCVSVPVPLAVVAARCCCRRHLRLHHCSFVVVVVVTAIAVALSCPGVCVLFSHTLFLSCALSLSLSLWGLTKKNNIYAPL